MNYSTIPTPLFAPNGLTVGVIHIESRKLVAAFAEAADASKYMAALNGTTKAQVIDEKIDLSHTASANLVRNQPAPTPVSQAALDVVSGKAKPPGQ